MLEVQQEVIAFPSLPSGSLASRRLRPGGELWQGESKPVQLMRISQPAVNLLVLRLFRLRRCLDSRAWQCLQAASLLFVLFGPDIVALQSAPDSINLIIDALLLGSMGLFALDLFLSVLCRHKLMWLEVHLPLPTDPHDALNSWLPQCDARKWGLNGMLHGSMRQRRCEKSSGGESCGMRVPALSS